MSCLIIDFVLAHVCGLMLRSQTVARSFYTFIILLRRYLLRAKSLRSHQLVSWFHAKVTVSFQ